MKSVAYLQASSSSSAASHVRCNYANSSRWQMDTACGTHKHTHKHTNTPCRVAAALKCNCCQKLSPVACLDLVVDMPHAYSCRDPKHTITITANSHTIVATKSGPTAAQISAQFKPEISRAPLLPGRTASQPASALSPAPFFRLPPARGSSVKFL